MIPLLACLAASAARGASDSVEGPVPGVAVLRPASDDAVLVEASRRIPLELGASGTSGVLVDEAGAFAARVALVREDGVVTIDVLGTPAAGAPLHRRVRVPREQGGDDPAVIAVRAVELLRGIRLEVRRPPPRAPARSAAPDAGPDPTPAREPAPEAWRFEAGLGVLTARPLGAALAVGPALAAAGAVAPHLSFTASFAGPFSTDRPGSPDGSAHTTEELAGLGLRAESWRPGLNVHAVATVGLHHVSAVYDTRGMPDTPPTVIHLLTPQSVWNPVLTIAAGASLRIARRLGVSLQLAAIFVEPALELVSNGRALATLGGPSVLSSVAVWTTL